MHGGFVDPLRTDVASSLVGQGASQDMGCGRGSADGERRCGTASWKLRKGSEVMDEVMDEVVNTLW